MGSDNAKEAQQRIELGRELLKIINDQIWAKNTRVPALASLETLSKITKNALDDATKRKLRLNNPSIKQKITSVDGALAYLQKSYFASKKQLDTLQLAYQTVEDRRKVLAAQQDRSEEARRLAKIEEENRVKRAKLQIQEDRLDQKARAERESRQREMRAAALERQQAHQEAERRYQQEQPSLEDKKSR